MKIQYRVALELFLIAMIFLALKDCGNKQVEGLKPINDSLLIKANLSNVNLTNDITNLNVSLQLLKLTKQGLKVVYKDKVKNVYLTAPDTCRTYIDTVIKWHNKIDLTNDSTILVQDSIIKDYSKMIVNYKDIVMVKDIQHYNDSLSLKKAKKNSRLKIAQVGIITFLGGLLIGTLK
jgi:hypothetical protein